MDAKFCARMEAAIRSGNEVPPEPKTARALRHRAAANDKPSLRNLERGLEISISDDVSR